MIAWSRGGKVKSPMMSLRIEKIIIIAIIGTAATPFTTALQNSALIGSIGVKFMTAPTSVATARVPQNALA
jgi:hypothetical protein